MSKRTAPTKQRKKMRINCERKVQHPTREAATQAMGEVAAKRGRFDNLASVYQCPVCGFWHWGRLPGAHALMEATP